MKKPACLERVKAAAIDLFFPEYNTCHICNLGLTGEKPCCLCEDCLEKLNKLCLPPTDGRESTCPPLVAAISGYRYADEARDLVLALKYHSDSSVATLLAEGMSHAFATELSGSVRRATVVVPVPLHELRLLDRGMNQAEVLARHVSEHIGIPMDTSLLKRTVYTQPQVGKGREERIRAMRNVFAADAAAAGKHVLLVDDVMTTGSTAAGCAKALLDAGAAEVSLLTACRD